MKPIIIIICVAVVAIGLVVVATVNRGERQALMATLGFMLRAVNREYQHTDPLDTEKRRQIVSPNGSFQPVVFTRVFTLGGTNYYCQLAVKFVSFGKPGILAVTTNNILLFVDNDNQATIISFPSDATRNPTNPFAPK